MDWSWLPFLFLFLALWYIVRKPNSGKSKPLAGWRISEGTLDTADSGIEPYRFAEDAIPISLTLTFSYRDSQGAETERTVDVKKVYPGQKISFFDGYCSLRNSNRTFRTDRVFKSFDAQTGEIIQDLSEYMSEAVNKSPFARGKKLANEQRDVLMVLLFLAKADGQLRAAERSVITNTCNQITGQHWTDDDIKAALSSMETPSRQAFNLAVGRVARDHQLPLDTIMDAARAIVATQKAVHPAEQEALDYILRRLTDRA